jgi:putative flippase GtrA
MPAKLKAQRPARQRNWRALREPVRGAFGVHPVVHPISQGLRYVVIAGCGYLLAVGAYSGELALGIAPYLGLGIAFVLNGLFNFALLRVWAFPSSGRSVSSDLARFCAVAVASFLVNYATFAVLYSAIGLAADTSQRLGILIAAPVTFLGNRVWSFRVHRTEAADHDEPSAQATAPAQADGAGGLAPTSAKNESYSRM